MFDPESFPWLKSKGYLHITPKINVLKEHRLLIEKVTNAKFVARYAFFPLIHSSIRERRYRRDHRRPPKRFHTKKLPTGEIIRNAKSRPLHYATHLDSLIFGYYSHLLYIRYEEELSKSKPLAESVIAYRKIKIPGEIKNKGTIHFAHEVFKKIKENTEHGPVCVLKFDIESFFSRMDHQKLLSQWILLFPENGKLPVDHFNVYKATTKFSYILKDDLRFARNRKEGGKRPGFDEKKLAQIRNETGRQSFFLSTKEFRESVKDRSLPIYKYPFRAKDGKICGIPQGLPISSVLANIYLLDFDREMIALHEQFNTFYRRYSDDIILICSPADAETVKKVVNKGIEKCRLTLSGEKTEQFIFENISLAGERPDIISYKITDQGEPIRGIPLAYLGFEFFGNRIAVKSANLSKFYRRMILTVKRKCKRAKKVSENNPGSLPMLFFRKIYKLYTLQNLSRYAYRNKNIVLKENLNQGYTMNSAVYQPKFRTNYLTYIGRAAQIMGEESIKEQLSKHQKILKKAVAKHLFK